LVRKVMTYRPKTRDHEEKKKNMPVSINPKNQHQGEVKPLTKGTLPKRKKNSHKSHGFHNHT